VAQATFPPISDTAAFDLLATMNDGVAIVTAQNRLWVHKATGWATSELLATAEDIRASWATNIAPLVQTEYVLYQINAKNWDNPLNVVNEVTFTAVPGTAVGDPIPFTSCAIVRWSTSGVTPSSCYIRHGGIVEANVDGQHLSVGHQSAIATGWDALSDDITTVERDHVCVQVYQPNPTPPDIFKDAGTFEDVQSVVVRRRLGRSVSRQK